MNPDPDPDSSTAHVRIRTDPADRPANWRMLGYSDHQPDHQPDHVRRPVPQAPGTGARPPDRSIVEYADG